MKANHPPIYWVEVWLNQDVHMIGLGFTRLFHKYACANTREEAEAVVLKWSLDQCCDVKKIVALRSAVIQDVKTYTFPDRIINLPDEVLQSEYERRGYPESMRERGQQVKAEVAHA